MAETVRVRARPGHRMPMPASAGTAAGAKVLWIDDGEAVEVTRTPFVRRRIAAGDLVEVVEVVGDVPVRPSEEPAEGRTGQFMRGDLQYRREPIEKE